MKTSLAGMKLSSLSQLVQAGMATRISTGPSGDLTADDREATSATSTRHCRITHRLRRMTLLGTNRRCTRLSRIWAFNRQQTK